MGPGRPSPRHPAAVLALAVPAIVTVASCITVDGASDRSPVDLSVAPPPALADRNFPPEDLVPPYEDDAAWPARWGEFERDGKGVIVPFAGPLDAWRGVTLGRFHRLRPDAPERRDADALSAALPESSAEFRFEGGRSFVFLRGGGPRSRGGPAARPARGTDDPVRLLRFVSGRLVDAGGTVSQPGPRVDITRSWFALYAPAETTEAWAEGEVADARGLILFMPGLYCVPGFVMDMLVNQARRDGWAVLRMLAPQSRFTEYAELTIDARTDAALRETLAGVAGEISERFAEQAYAAAAALEHVREVEPGLREKPWAAMGFSAGAISMPVTLAWIERDLGLSPDASILVAGGAGGLEITERSSYARFVDAIDLDWLVEGVAAPVESAPDAVLARAADAYLELSPLDGYHTARAMRTVPTLMLHATGDEAVPASSGDLLWERLGRPERWNVPLDHGPLFVGLFARGPRLYDWLEETVPRRDAAADAGAESEGAG